MKNPRHAFNVEDTFELKGRGLIVIANKLIDDIPLWSSLKMGDEIEFRIGEDLILKTTISGIAMSQPKNEKRQFDFLIPPDIATVQIISGCEIWVGESSVKATEDKPT